MHSRPGLDQWGREDWNCAEGRNPNSLQTFGPNLELLVINDPRTTPSQVAAAGRLVWSEPFKSKTWYDFVMHVRISPGENGMMRVWRNGELIYERFGGNIDILDGCGRPKVPPKAFLGDGDRLTRASGDTEHLIAETPQFAPLQDYRLHARS